MSYASGQDCGRRGVNSDNPSHPQYEIPRELQEVLLDFTVHYLVEQPGNVVDFAVDYFTRLATTRRNQGHHENHSEEDESMLSDEDVASNGGLVFAAGRRKSVFAETYDPEEDEQDEKVVVHPKSDSQRKGLLEAVKEILLFRSLEPEQLSEVLDAMFEYRVNAGDFIIRQGDDGDNFYVVESGIYNIYVNNGGQDNLVGKCENTGSFGELALMYNMPRAASIQAASNGMLWAMDRQTFRRIVLRNAFQKRKMYEKLLETVPLLSSLSQYERMSLADALVPKSYTPGSIIVKQGAPADGMYFVESGKANVFVAGTDGQERMVTTVEKGGYFGELALVTHKPRAATVQAFGDVRVAFLDVNAFERLLGQCMDVMKRNIDDYEDQLVRIFGSKANISDIR